MKKKSAKWLWHNIFPQFTDSGKKAWESLTTAREYGGVVLLVSDWPIIMISTSGLLLP
jgi:hypothetical protein